MRERASVCVHDSQRGFTLVELMISVLIAVLLLGALLTIVQANRAVFGDQSQLALLQDSERMAMTMMADVIQSAGYFPNPTSNTKGTALSPATYGAVTFASGQSLNGTYSAADPGDSIYVRYMTASSVVGSGDGILNCSGTSNTSGANALYLNVFQVVGGQLVCTVYINGGAGTPYNLVSGATNSTTTLGVTHLSVLYGVKTSSTTTGNNVDTYMPANLVTNWSSVISAQVTLTFTNPLYVAPGLGQPATISFQRVISVMNQVGPTL